MSNIFFSGICGISMSGAAILAAKQGHRVSGSDREPCPEIRAELEAFGIKVFCGHKAENADGCDIFVYTAAISPDNPELERARQNGASIYTRAGFIAEITKAYSNRIGIAGTHGKSTVCGMCEAAFIGANVDITSLIGAKNPEGKAYRIGSSDTVLFEACEYKRSFLNFRPTVGTVLNIERDHTDCYPTMDSEISAFSAYLDNCNTAILNSDDPYTKKLRIPENTLYFSLNNKKADVYAENLRCEHGLFRYTGVINGKDAFEISLKVPGIHNVKNSLAAMANAYICGLDLTKASKAISDFRGMKRRFEYKGSINGCAVYDDYAHHPTEIRATLRTAKEMGFYKIYCAFQSHTYSRTSALFSEFCSAFEDADKVFITDIYAAREKNDIGVSGKSLAANTPRAEYSPDLNILKNQLTEYASPGAVILTLGAGELNKISSELCQ